MKEVQNIYRVEDLPVFQNRMYLSQKEAEGCPNGNVNLVQDLKTGFIFNSEFNSELMNYDQDYQNEQALSQSFRKHLDNVLEIFRKNFSQCSIIEIGCGKGYFLDLLSKSGFSVSGYDPAYEGDSPNIHKEMFTSTLGVHAECIVLRHVLEHVKEPVKFLENLKEANNGGGIIYIEVPCFDWICDHKAWFDIFYEHVNYFRLCDLEGMFDGVLQSGRLFGDQYIYVIAELDSLKMPVFSGKNRIDFPEDFLSGIEQFANIQKNKKLSIWGGASKGVIFSIFMKRLGFEIECIIDINPAKQGKYIPATGYKVQSPEEAMNHLPSGSTIFVMNSNYIEEIKAMSGNRYHYVGIDHEWV
jgi:hypothetical protein